MILINDMTSDKKEIAFCSNKKKELYIYLNF